MSKYLAVEIEHSKYARFLSLEGRDRRSSNLTTLVNNQQRAEVKVYIVVEGRKELLHSFKVTSIPPQRAGEPRLLLSGNFDGKHTVRLALKVNGKPYADKDLQVRRYLHRRRGGLIAGLFAAGLILVLLLWLLLRGCSADEAPASAGSPPEMASPEITSSESASHAADDAAGSKDTARDTDASGKSSSGSTGSTSGTTTKTASKSRTETTGKRTSTQGSDGMQGPEGKTSESSSRFSGTNAAGSSGSAGSADSTAAAAAEPIQAPVLESGTVYFEPDTSILTPAAREKLGTLAEELLPYGGSRIRILGHCALYGTERGRIELSRQRAQEAYTYLREAGWRPQSPPDIIGMGGKEPVTTDEDRQYLNRRVEILIR